MSQKFQYLTLDESQAGIVIIRLDMPGRGANILDRTLFAELDQAMLDLAQQTELQGIVLASAKPSIFIAGADLNAIASSLDWPDQSIVEFCENGRRVMARFSQTPFPTVAAIHGACVGGGMELALWCDYRIATDDRRTQLGLPEVKLGLVPGWAGTVRLPRLIGFEPAAELAVTGRSISAEEGLRLGLVDRVTTADELIGAAVQWIRSHQAPAKSPEKSPAKSSAEVPSGFVGRRQRLLGRVGVIRPDQTAAQTAFAAAASAVTRVSDRPAAGADRPAIPDSDPAGSAMSAELSEVVAGLKLRIARQSDVYPLAPSVLLRHMAQSFDQTYDQAAHSESLAMAEVWGSPPNRGLLNHFFLGDYSKKMISGAGLPISTLQRVGIVGAGLMGLAIAKNCLQRKIEVVLIDSDPNRLEEASRALADLNLPAAGGPIAETSQDFSGLAGTDLVIESVVENFRIKSEVLQQIEQVVGTDKIIASNTSAIPITRLATALKNPQRFCGIHFCHPQLMALVELIRGTRTGDAAMGIGLSWVRQLGKTPVLLKDGPGFVVNRLLAAMLNQAIDLLWEGYAVEEIDQAMRDFGFLGGPFEIIDTIGVETCMYAGHEMWKAGVTCVSLSPLLPKLAKLGRMGRKTGLGVYRYSDRTARGTVDPDFAAIVASYRRAQPDPDKHDPVQNGSAPSLGESPIANKILLAMVAEAENILREQIVNDIRDIELCVIHGLGFPPHQGGLLFWSDQMGLSQSLHSAGRFYQ
jgi:3-hydroxyacyl-CoA dehydrogenase/enoyl-CoA hydratase/3-hydroxybutyryl-CoA epimerase